MITDDIREAARQAAREAVAALYRADGHHNAADIVLMGRRDHDREVGFALAVADAALAAVLPMVVAKCAEVARERITGIAGKTPAELLHNSHAHAGAVTAQEIERAILARVEVSRG